MRRGRCDRLNCLPPPLGQRSPRQSRSRHGHPLPPFGRCLLHCSFNQLRSNSPKHANQCPNYRACAPVCLISSNYLAVVNWRIARTSSRNYNTTHRPKPKHHLFRPNRRRRPRSLPTPLLIFWPPRSVYLNLTSIWNNFPCCCPLLWEKTSIWPLANNLRHAGYRVFRVYRLRTPYVHRRPRCRHSRILLCCNHDHCRTHRS